MEHLITNFTAIMPSTCNADCHFCPEKEMDVKETRSVWLSNLITSINETHSYGYDHVSISGGEPTLLMRFLKSVIDEIHEHTNIKKIGITTNGQFLESMNGTQQFIDLSNGLSFINISRHSFIDELNNTIMGVDYKHTIDDIIMLRKYINPDISFHINYVVTDIDKWRSEIELLKSINNKLIDCNIKIAFRLSYELNESQEKIEEFTTAAKMAFGDFMLLSECPTCFSAIATNISYNNIIIKYSSFEPTNEEDVMREFVFHQNGKLYYDWSREKPYFSNVMPFWSNIEPYNKQVPVLEQDEVATNHETSSSDMDAHSIAVRAICSDEYSGCGNSGNNHPYIGCGSYSYSGCGNS